MKSLHVITALNFGGAEAMLAKLLSQPQSAIGPANALVVSLMKPGTVGKQMIARGIAVETLDLRHPWHLPRAMAQLNRIVSGFDPDLVQGWMYHGNIAASLAGRMARKRLPMLWNIRHSLSRPSAERLMSRAVIRLGAQMSRAPQATIYNSATSQAEHAAYGYCPERAIVIPNGFDCATFEPEDADRRSRQRLQALFGIDEKVILVAMVARSHPMKDHATAIEAVGRARAAGHDIHLLLAGAGTEALPAKVRAAYANWIPSDRLTLAGDRRDVAEWLPGCDIIVLSSAWGEGFPNILGEAMAAGVPCVATDVGDSKVIVGDGGMCVPNGEPEAMATAIVTLCQAGTDGRREIGVRGRYRILTQYALPAISERYTRLYESVLRSPSERPLPMSASQCAG